MLAVARMQMTRLQRDTHELSRDVSFLWGLCHALDTPIVKPMLGDSGGVFGAAFLVA